MLSSAAHYSKLVTCPNLPACTLNQKKAILINIGLLPYTFTKLGDNMTNNDGDMPSGLNTHTYIHINVTCYELRTSALKPVRRPRARTNKSSLDCRKKPVDVFVSVVVK